MKKSFSIATLGQLGSLQPQMVQSTLEIARAEPQSILISERTCKHVLRLMSAMLHFLPEPALESFKKQGLKVYLSNYFDMEAISAEVTGRRREQSATTDPLGSYFHDARAAVVGIQSKGGKDRSFQAYSMALATALWTTDDDESFFKTLRHKPEGAINPAKQILAAERIAAMLEDGIREKDTQKITAGLRDLSKNETLCRIIKTMAHELGHAQDLMVRGKQSLDPTDFLFRGRKEFTPAYFRIISDFSDVAHDGPEARNHPLSHYLGLKKPAQDRSSHMRSELFAETWGQTWLTGVTRAYGVPPLIRADTRVQKYADKYWSTFQKLWDRQYYPAAPAPHQNA